MREKHHHKKFVSFSISLLIEYLRWCYVRGLNLAGVGGLHNANAFVVCRAVPATVAATTGLTVTRCDSS